MPVIPDLSHLVDYEVSDARTTDDGFEIQFVDDTVVRSYRQDVVLPDLPDGMEWDDNLRLLRILQDELETRIHFAHKSNPFDKAVEVVLDPNRYSISGSRTQGEEIFPQRREDDQSLPPDPSIERPQEFPEHPEWLDSPDDDEPRKTGDLI